MPRSKAAGRGGTLLGVFIGLVLGLAIAAAVAYFLGRSGLTTPMPPPGGAKEPARGARPDLGGASPATEKPRFDFYKILPGGEEPKPGAIHGNCANRRARRSQIRRSLLAASGRVRERSRCRGHEGATCAFGVGGGGSARRHAGQDAALSRSTRALRQHRRAQSREEGARQPWLRCGGDQELTRILNFTGEARPKFPFRTISTRSHR